MPDSENTGTNAQDNAVSTSLLQPPPPVRSAPHRSAPRWPAPPGHGHLDRHPGASRADTVDIGRGHRSPRPHPNRPPRTSAQSTSPWPTSVPPGDGHHSKRAGHHPSGRDRQVTPAAAMEVAGEVGRAGAGRPESGRTARPSPVDCRCVTRWRPGTTAPASRGLNRPLGT
jgi:hypothetical protein